MFRLIVIIFTCILCCGSSIFSEYTDSAFAFKVNFNAQWHTDTINSNKYFVYNANTAKKTKIYLERIKDDTAAILTDNELAQVYFVANYSIAKSYGIVQYYDTGTTVHIGTLKAYELFAFYRDVKTDPKFWWAELSRFCATGGCLFQVTILGDTTDIINNFDTYKSMLNQIEIWSPQKTATGKTIRYDRQKQTTKMTLPMYMLNGQIISNGTHKQKPITAGCLISPGYKILNINRKQN